MLWYAWVFLVIAILAAVFGFGGIAAGAGSKAKIFFFVFVVLFVISLIAGRYSGLYVVNDTGPKIAGAHIDIYIPSRLEAKRFGKRRVRLRVLQRAKT